MLKRNQHKRSEGPFKGLKQLAQKSLRGLLAASLVLSPLSANSANAAILNTAQVSGSTPGGTTVSSPPANEVVTTVVGAESMAVTKTGTLNDDDGVAGISAGDTITYTVTVENTGSLSLSNVTPNDPMATLTLQSGDTDNDGLLDPDEIWTYSGSYSLTQADIDSNGGGDGAIENTVTVSTTELADESANAIVPLDINPSMDLTKVGVLNDDDGVPGLSAGDTITYTVTVRNTGNIRMTNVVVNDPMVALSYQSGDLNSDNRLDVGEEWSYTGTTIISQGDIDTLGGGDGDIDNTASVSTDQLPSEDVSHELPIAPISSMEIKKVATAPVQLFPTIYEFDYQLTVRNTGAMTQTNIRVADDLAAAISPATLAAAPSVSISGFAGSGGYNASYDGVSDTQLLTGDVQLAPGDIALITITVRIDTGGQSISGLNTALLTSDIVTTPIPSDDPTLTPGIIGDINPTPVQLPDRDGDGSPDANEDGTPDRDGDGSGNSNDYDPTGYFYCEADGRILSGGLITVENLTAGGSQTGLGTSNGITILRDGSDGRFQFHALQSGTFRLSYVLPTGGIASTTRLSSGTLDVTSLLPSNPGVIGSGEYGSTGYLADSSAAANPFFTTFEIEAGDPAVFNNNIPLQYCGAPQLTVAKTVEAGPDLQPDLRHRVVYRLDMQSSGDEPVNNVQMVDDLAAVFGAGNFTIESLVMDSAPVGFTATTDPVYNGDSNTALLTSGGTLEPGEAVSLLLTVLIDVSEGVYLNALVGNGTSPLDGSGLVPVRDDAGIRIVDPNAELVVTKTARPGSARMGDPVTYTITVANRSLLDATNVEIVDVIPNGMTYVAGSARVDGVAIEPQGSALTGSGRELVWSPVTIPAEDSVVVTLTLVINAAGSNDEYINTAFVRDPSDGSIISNRAQAKVRAEIDPVFECSDLIGRVFDDLDKDGYFDEGEPGLPGVRLATPNGLLIVTDEYGRYSIACGAVPDADIGSNFLLKLDPRTLPTGYRVTSENPRVVRLTRGKLVRLNFAAANLRVVRLELTDDSFLQGSDRPSPDTLRSIGGLLSTLEEEPSVLRLVYNGPSVGGASGRGRLENIEALVKKAWNARSRPYRLTIETRLID